MYFKPGDKVAIRPDIEEWKKYGHVTARPDMVRFAGIPTIVTSVTGDTVSLRHCGGYIYHMDMLIPAVDLPKYVREADVSMLADIYGF